MIEKIVSKYRPATIVWGNGDSHFCIEGLSPLSNTWGLLGGTIHKREEDMYSQLKNLREKEYIVLPIEEKLHE